MPCAFCSGVVSAWCRLLRKSDVWPVGPLTRWPFQKRTPQGQFRGPPTYTHQVWRRSVKGPRRSRGTNRQTDRQTDKRCSNYSMIQWRTSCSLVLINKSDCNWLHLMADKDLLLQAGSFQGQRAYMSSLISGSRWNLHLGKWPAIGS